MEQRVREWVWGWALCRDVPEPVEEPDGFRIDVAHGLYKEASLREFSLPKSGFYLWENFIAVIETRDFMLITAFVMRGPIVIGLDETIERRWGKKIEKRGIYRDPVRSSRGHFVKTSGLRWASVMLLVPIPLEVRVDEVPDSRAGGLAPLVAEVLAHARAPGGRPSLSRSSRCSRPLRSRSPTSRNAPSRCISQSCGSASAGAELLAELGRTGAAPSLRILPKSHASRSNRR